MTKLLIDIESENDAFNIDGGSLETARILRLIASDIENGQGIGLCVDHNGNKVGRWDFRPTLPPVFNCACGAQWAGEYGGANEACPDCGETTAPEAA